MSNTSADVYNEENKTVKNCEDVSSVQLSVSNVQSAMPTQHVENELSASSNESCSSSSTSSSEEEDRPPPKRPRKERHVRSDSRDSFREIDLRFEQLSRQLVSHLNNTFCNYVASSNSHQKVSTESNVNLSDPFSNSPIIIKDIAQLDVSVQEPQIPKANSDRVSKLISMQRFNSSDWNGVRYVDIQKKYVAFPAFTELKINEELRFLEHQNGQKSYLMERSFAALSNAFLAQNEFVNKALRSIIDWSSQSDVILNSSSIYDKLKEFFGQNSEYKAVSHDILQIICGKRAEALELRRKTLLTNLKRKYVREDLDKIPPSAEYMFNPEILSTYLQKMGGTDKIDKIVGSQPKTRGKSPAHGNPPMPSTSQEKPFRVKQYNAKQNHKKQNTEDFDKKQRGGRKSNRVNKYKHK
ncbi:unnamed protein product [Leptosia nina]|uniref:Uncharacterized protein n=1 Tax=Leptosia nina TaxID=320188 RepID=A0AAV1JU97_9NEOP